MCPETKFVCSLKNFEFYYLVRIHYRHGNTLNTFKLKTDFPLSMERNSHSNDCFILQDEAATKYYKLRYSINPPLDPL